MTKIELPSVEVSELSKHYPVRLPVWWARTGIAGPHPITKGGSGRQIVLLFQKKFNKLEKIIRIIFKGPKVLRRPLDDLNSLIWELCNGLRSFDEICRIMDVTFHERVAPVAERTAMALRQLERLGCLAIIENKFDGGWEIGPGIVPNGQDSEFFENTGFDTDKLNDELSEE